MSERKYCVRKKCCCKKCCCTECCDLCEKPCCDPCEKCCCDPCKKPCCNTCQKSCCDSCKKSYYDPCCDPCPKPCDPCDPRQQPLVPTNFFAPFDPGQNCYCNTCCNQCCDACCRLCQDPRCGRLTPQSFGTFFNNKVETVPPTRPFSFTQVGPGTSDICLVPQNVIRVQNAGVYNVFYNVGVNVPSAAPTDPVRHRINLYVNYMQQPNSHTDFSVPRPSTSTCVNISGCATVCVPDNAAITLVNDSQFVGGGDITTCSNGNSNVVLSIKRIK